MSVSGTEIRVALESIRRLHRQIALLLQSADVYLTDSRGYALASNVCRDYGSAIVDNPDEWMPNVVFRFYRPTSADAASTLTFISVILCPRFPESHAVTYTEPLVSAGWARFESPPAFDAKRYFWASVITDAPVPRDGTVFRSRGEGSKRCVEYGCFAVPLVQIAGTDDLVARVLDPLCRLVSGSGQVTLDVSSSLPAEPG